MPDRRRFAVVVTPLLAALLLIGVAAAILLPSGAAPAAAQGTEPAVTCFEIGVGWRICAAPGVPLEPPPGPCATGAAVPDAANNPGLVADCAILLAAKDTLRGTPPRVTELRLEGHALTGTIPAALGDLSQLRRLHLGYNQLSGRIPPALGNLARLEVLSLFVNRLTGAIPAELGNLARLGTLDFAWNRLTGAIPPELGNLAQLRILQLQQNQLTGAIPPGLADLPLSELSLSQNDLTGCLLRALAQVERNDVAQLGLASCPLGSESLTYGPPITTDSVPTDGDYAFLTDPDDLTSAITTYEGLRAGTRIGLVLHQNDISGASQAVFYAQVEAGDLVEWREAADCWVRYHVDEVHADPAGDPPRTLLTIQVYSYAYTGCTSGPITTRGTRTFTWTPENIQPGRDAAGGAPAPPPPGPCAAGAAVPDAANNPGLVADCAILLAARGRLRGTAALDWSADRGITAWDGVTVGGTPPHVTALDLEGHALTGTIPPALGALARLQWLWLNGNGLTGPIPPELGNLAQLRILRLYNNRLTGAIPRELGALARLESLLLNNNRLTGPIPPELGNLAQLQRLWLHGNRLTGAIPRELGALARLGVLNLNGNRLTGSIPPELGALARLGSLHLPNNQLTGAIPPELGNLAQLESLVLRENRLTGAIPSELGNLAQLQRLALHENRLMGPIPPELGALTRLKTLRLYDNRLTGPIPPELGALARLEVLYLHGNLLWGAIPPELGNLAQLKYLTLSANRLTGPIPPELGNLAQLGSLTLGENRLTGAIPPELGDLARLTYLQLDGNRLTGPIPPELGNLAQLQRLALHENRLTGAIPPELGNLAALEVLDLGGNQLSGPIPAALGNLAALEVLDLGGNQLSGPIPAALGNLAGLVVLDLRGNQLSGPIPVELRNPPHLIVYLADNRFTGCLPRELAGMRSNDFAALGLADCDLPSTTLTYGAPTTTGSVTDDGDYAFLTDPDDLTTMITTYEGLRDGSTTGLVIHKHDSAGASQADLLDLVEAGDLFEWRQASDCFVRYTVTDVKDDPAGDPPRKLLAVAWMTYAFTGCSGAISPTATASLQFGPLPDLGGPSLTSPVRHGPYQLVPAGWTGAVEEPDTYPLPGDSYANPAYTTNLAEARQLPYWRDPALPAGWTFAWAVSGDVSGPAYGYWADFATERGGSAFTVFGYYADYRGHPREASWRNGRGVYETRVIAGRPARVAYSPSGPNHSDLFPVTVWIYDASTEAEYAILGKTKSLRGSNVDAVIAIARSLFEPPNAP